MEETIADRLARVRQRIKEAAMRAGRVDLPVLVAVTKTVPPDRVLACYEAGQRVFGENRVQEAETKIAALREQMPDARWHLIGHLQRNKARRAADAFALIESVDSLTLARRMSSLAGEMQRELAILLEVNVAGEASKSGFAVDELRGDFSEVFQLPHLQILGLMTVAPLSGQPEDVRWVFRRLRELRDDASQQFDAQHLTELSMGMTSDFETAIEEGATMVRIGSAIFGARPPFSGGATV